MDQPTNIVSKTRKILKDPVTWGSGAVGAAVGAASMFAVSGGFSWSPVDLDMRNCRDNTIIVVDTITLGDNAEREAIVLPPMRVSGPER